MSQAIFLLSCAVLFVVPLVFVSHRTYRDGVVGRGALLCVSFSSFMFLAEAVSGHPFYVPPLVVLMVASFAVFLGWHCLRFILRVRRETCPQFRGCPDR